jgi:hypothetical protein
MEKLARLSLLAETFEPVLADDAGGTGETAVFVDVLVWLAKGEVCFEPRVKGERDVLGGLEANCHGQINYYDRVGLQKDGCDSDVRDG